MWVLIDRVIDQIKKDVASEDMTAIAEMLTHVSPRHLEAYLPEDLDEWTTKDEEAP